MKFLKLATVVTALVLSTSANAALVGRLAATTGGTDYQAYYDDVADLTWLADANANGVMNWADANNWAAGLTVNGVDGWRLADTLQPDASCDNQSGGASSGFDCTGSELGNLFYNVLGGSAYSSITTTHNANYGLFSNVQSDFYWTATELNTDVAWVFGMNYGNQGTDLKTYNKSVWAVQSGDVSAVPVPAAVWLFGSGLIGLVGFARRNKA